MRIPLLKHNISISHLFPILFIVVLIGIMVPHAAHADTNCSWWPPWSCLSPSNIALSIAILAAWIIQVVLTVLLYIVSFIVDNLFIFNVILNPNNMPAVIGGWKILRDISNSLFLLVLLWLAIKIIWGYGSDSKRLLVRLIIMAFLINFSLALTGAAFGFGNALAKPFRDKLGDDVAGFIVSRSKINTSSIAASNKGTQQAAAIVSSAQDCMLNALTNTTIKVKCPDKTIAAEVMGTVASGASWVGTTLLESDGVRNIMQIYIADIFLLLIVIMFGGVAGFLIVRIAMMAFLGVLAPAAFFLYAVPGGESLFKRWLKNVIGWSFIAPTFYFLFYISLIVLDAMTKSPMTQVAGKIPFAANVFAMMPLIIFLVFMGVTMSTCKKLGAEVADTAIKMGKMAAGVALTAAAGVATGGVSLAAGAAARGAGGAIQGTSNWLAEKPVLGRITAPITRRVGGYYQKRNEGIEKLKENYTNIPTRQLTQQLRTTLSTDKKIAMADVLHGRKGSDGYSDFDKLDESTQLKVMHYEDQIGRHNFLKARPDQATTKNVPDTRNDYEAKKKVANNMTSEEKSRMSKYAIRDDETKKAVLETATKADMEAIIRYNADMTQQLLYGFFAQNETMMRSIMKQETLNFIYSNPYIRVHAGARRNTPPTPPAGGAPPTPGTPTP